MKTIQSITYHQFTAKEVAIGKQVISISAVVASFGLICLPFLLLLARLS